MERDNPKTNDKVVDSQPQPRDKIKKEAEQALNQAWGSMYSVTPQKSDAFHFEGEDDSEDEFVPLQYPQNVATREPAKPQSPRKLGDDRAADELFKGVDKEKHASEKLPMEKAVTENDTMRKSDLDKFAQERSENVEIAMKGVQECVERLDKLATSLVLRDGKGTKTEKSSEAVPEPKRDPNPRLTQGSQVKSGVDSSAGKAGPGNSGPTGATVTPVIRNPFEKLNKDQAQSTKKGSKIRL